MAKRRSLLTEILIDAKVITDDQLQRVLDEQLKTNAYLGTILVRLGYAKEQDVYTLLSKRFLAIGHRLCRR